MGRKTREMVEKSGVNVDELIMMLKKAFADEWIAYYYYNILAYLAKGTESPEIADRIKKTAAQELEHQRELAERIIQLEGEPPKRFEELVKMANCPYVEIPSDLGDSKAIAKAIVDAEGCAIEAYRGMLDWLMSIGKDYTTFHIIRHIMQEEEEHEDEFQTIMGI
jgi:bacterioferritin